MTITQADIERAYGLNGTAGTDYDVALTQTNDVHFCDVTNNESDPVGALVARGQGPTQNAACKQAAEGDPLNLHDNIDEAARIRIPTIALATSGALVIDAAAGDHQSATLTADVTSVAVINLPAAGFAQTLNLIFIQGAGNYQLPVGAWTGVIGWKPIGGSRPEMPSVLGQILYVPIYFNGNLAGGMGDWWTNE